MAAMPGNHTVERLMTLPPKLRTSRACYGITWEVEGGIVQPRSMDGMHPFLQESKHYKFDIGEDYVGQIFKQGPGAAPQVLSDIGQINPRDFTRKRFAIVSGIESIAFMPQADGSLLELGFSCREDAHVTLSTLVNLDKCGKVLIPVGESDLTESGGSPDSSDNHLCTSLPGNVPPDKSSVISAHEAKSACSVSDSVLPSTSSALFHESIAAATEEETFIVQSQGSAADMACAYALNFNVVPCPASEYPVDARASWPAIPFFCPWTGMVLDPGSLSRGSIGHPFHCGDACKYVWKQKGCKDGTECTHCHLCTYSRWKEKHPAAQRARQRKRH